MEISCEPCVRKHVRSNFMDHAVVSTCPTPDGNLAIDSFHQFAGVKWLREKPLSAFDDAQWFLIQKAEEERLLQVTVKMPERDLEKLINEFNEYYLSDGVSKSAQLWNEQRKLILQDALFGFLMPSMEKEARSLLTSRAKNWLLMEYGNVLWNKVSVGPYQRKETDINSDEEAAPRVMACCWGPGKPATTFVMLDSSGEVLDVLYTGSLTLRSQNVNDQQRKKNDQERVLKFMTDHQPHVVVLGAVNLSCTRLKEDIYEVNIIYLSMVVIEFLLFGIVVIVLEILNFSAMFSFSNLWISWFSGISYYIVINIFIKLCKEVMQCAFVIVSSLLTKLALPEFYFIF